MQCLEEVKENSNLKWLGKAKQQKITEDSQGNAQDSTLHSNAVLEDLDESSVFAIDTSKYVI